MGDGQQNWWDDKAIFRAIAPRRIAVVQRPELSIGRAAYLGGFSSNERSVEQNNNAVRIDQGGITFRYLSSAYPKDLVSIPWAQVEGLDIDAEDELEGQGAGGRGLFGRIGQKKSATILKVRTTRGDRVRFRTLSMNPDDLRTTLAPVLEAIDSQRQRAKSVPASARESASTKPAPTTPAESSATVVTGSLRELTELHERGALTDEEFAAAKRRVIEP